MGWSRQPLDGPGEYRFGPFAANTRDGELRKLGVRLKLQKKPFQILLTLLERPGELVTREELRDRLWASNTFVEFEHNLDIAVNKLRLTLGDSAESPRYMETVRGKGYRLVASVTVTDGHRIDAPVDDTETVAPEPARLPVDASKPGAGARRWALWVALAAALIAASIAAALAVLSAIYFRRPPPLTERDSILLADFSNSTGESVFDGTLKQALAVKLEESPFLGVVPEQQVQETLRFMGRSPNERLTEPVAREVCQRRGIKAMLAGSVERMGSHYVIALNVTDCSTGDSLAREQVEATSREHVLQAVGNAASKLRGKLGESLASLQRFDAPIEQATTVSLPALQAFGVGDELRAQGRETDAVPYYKHAIELDSNFGMAYARLAAIYANSSEFELASEEAQKAFALRDHASEREKFYIAFHYYDKVGEGFDKQIETCELWRHTYPRDWYPNNALAALYLYGEQFEKAVQAGREAVRLNPSHSLPYNNLAYAYMCSNRLAEAKALCATAIVNKLDGPDSDIHATLYQIAFLEKDSAGMVREVDSARGKPWEDSLLFAQYSAAALLGKLSEARELLRRYQKIELQRGFAESAALLQSAEAITEAEFGNQEGARKQGQAALALTHSKAVEKNVAFALARAGDTSGARTLLDHLIKSQSVRKNDAVFLPTLRAALEINGNDPARAVELLRRVLSTPDFTTTHTRGVAYLRMGAYKEAASEFHKILERRGAALLTSYPYYALAHLGLARAQAGLADFTSSRQSYEQFLALWENADPQIPVLQEARAEYAKLK